MAFDNPGMYQEMIKKQLSNLDRDGLEEIAETTVENRRRVLSDEKKDQLPTLIEDVSEDEKSLRKKSDEKEHVDFIKNQFKNFSLGP